MNISGVSENAALGNDASNNRAVKKTGPVLLTSFSCLLFCPSFFSPEFDLPSLRIDIEENRNRMPMPTDRRREISL